MEGQHDQGRLPLRERNKQRLIQRIVEAASTLFRDPGYEQTTMEMIAEKAEVSRGTLFNYFSTKTALLVPFANELYEQLVQPDVLAYLETQPTTLDVLRFLFLTSGERVLTFPGIVQALQHELYHPQPMMKTIPSGIGFFNTLQKIVLVGQQRGEVRVDLPAEKIADYIGVLYISLLQKMNIQHSSAAYHAEVKTLLAFLRSAFLP